MTRAIPETVSKIAGYPAMTAGNATQFRLQACAALEGRTSLDMDLSKTGVMDCAGLGALITVRTLARARQGGVRLIRPTPAVRRLFDIVHAEVLFEIDVNMAPAASAALHARCTFPPSSMNPGSATASHQT